MDECTRFAAIDVCLFVVNTDKPKLVSIPPLFIGDFFGGDLGRCSLRQVDEQVMGETS